MDDKCFKGMIDIWNNKFSDIPFEIVYSNFIYWCKTINIECVYKLDNEEVIALFKKYGDLCGCIN